MKIINRQRPAEWPKAGWYWLLHHEQLLEWTDDIDERWQYIINNKPADEIDLRLSEMAPVKGVLPQQIIDVCAEWERACAEWERAWAEWKRADAERKRADAERERADAERERADAERERADAERERACAEWRRADAERKRAYAELGPDIEALHRQECPNSKWNGKTIL